MDVKRIVLDVLTRVANDKGAPPIAWTDTLPLGADGAGFDRLDVATAVVELDQELAIDPFAEGAIDIQTVGQFVALYEQALATSGA